MLRVLFTRTVKKDQRVMDYHSWVEAELVVADRVPWRIRASGPILYKIREKWN